MNVTLRRSLFLLLLVLLLPDLGRAADSGARFTSVSNEVKVFPDGKEADLSFPRINDPLQFNDHVTTGEESTAIIAFADLSTFLIKAESEIVIATPEARKSNFELIAGKVWVNVKKMAAGESIEVKTNQSVTGIQGTNLTFDSNPVEDRITCLRGAADVQIRATREQVLLEEGMELVIRSGGRKELIPIDVGVESRKWSKELMGLGDAVPDADIPATIERMLDRQGKAHQILRDQFQQLMTAPSTDQARVQEFRKEADRFLGFLAENEIILTSFQARLGKGPARLAASRRDCGPSAACARTSCA